MQIIKKDKFRIPGEMKNIAHKLWFILFFLTFYCVSPSLFASSNKIHFIDAHLHYSPVGEDCSPKSKYAMKSGWKGMSTKEFIENLEKHGIDKVILSAPPTAIRRGIAHSDFCIPQITQLYPGRIFVTYGGEAFTLLHKVVIRGEYTKKQRNKFQKMLIEAMDSGEYVGFGEIGLYHLMTTKRKGNVARIPANHPWMFLLSNIASQYNVPIDIHMSATMETVSELEELLAHNRNTKIILAHAGWSELGMETPEFWERLLSKHPNLYSSIKHRKIGATYSDSRVALRGKNGDVAPEWLRLFEQFHDRFMIGSDIKPGVRKKKGNDFRHLKEMQEFLHRLPPHLRNKFTFGNANRVFNLSKYDGT
jgi:hypothetical protein